MMTAPKDDLTRNAPFEVTRADADGDGLTLEGYAAVFDTPTRIDSWEGKFDEVIARGAFTKTIKERSPVLQFDHGQHPLLGSLPLGSIQTLREDEHGLHVKARLSNNWLIEPVRDAIADGAVDGMSFRFSVVRDEWDHDTDPEVRTVREVKLYELGPVVFPAYESTSVGVRARKVAADLSDPELRHELAQLFASGTRIEPPEEGTRSEPLEDETDTPDDESTCQGASHDARERELSLIGALNE
jgi:HK97 family phage prohead protease